ncbi:uncharacterized protein LOC101856919 [Aplysia californica]|uniref:Uncharacterized protein LOC101856919 n=1 Tax=Aplysia californica TaxID=6500 RepID=A0ABM0K211_APLCA|nr:uncharacterized protein LOC101856919 [Aplysia californica]
MSVALSWAQCEGNPLVSYHGAVRQNLLYPRGEIAIGAHGSRELAGRHLDKPDCYFWDHCQVCNWACANSLGQYASMFRHYLVNGRRLLTIDALQLQRLGVSNARDALLIEEKIRFLRHKAGQEQEDLRYIPYFHFQALNSGQCLSRRVQRELPQFTDPWVNQTYKYLNMGAQWGEDPADPGYYSNSRC